MISVGAKHTAVARLWPHWPGTRRTVVDDDAAITRHDLVRTVPAVWTGQRRIQVSHSASPDSVETLTIRIQVSGRSGSLTMVSWVLARLPKTHRRLPSYSEIKHGQTTRQPTTAETWRPER
jgi:hypothetical protein